MINTIRGSARGGSPGVLRRIALPVFLLISAGAPPGSAESTLPLDPVYELKTDGSRRLLATRAWIDLYRFKSESEALAFFAVTSLEYMNHHYAMNGQWADGQWTGAWSRDDGQDHGTWEAVRPSSLSAAPSPEATVPLWEWRRTADDAHRYSIHPNLEEPGWERSPRPLARVWPKKVGD